MRENMIEAIVSQVHTKEGFVSASLRYQVGDVLKGTHITFSIKDWSEKDPPCKGQVVKFSEINLFEKGWRASKVQPIKIQRNIE
jgi:hypothetical protein